MPQPEHRYIRPALLVNFHRNETPSPVEWVAVEEPTPPPSNAFMQWLKDNCCCDCTSSRSNETTRCVIS